jgi:hypothetical protein
LTYNSVPIERGRETLKKPTNREEAPQPRNVQRADIVPSSGYVLVVDGCMKTEYGDEAAAKKAAEDLLKRYPMLFIQVFDAKTKTRATLKSSP